MEEKLARIASDENKSKSEVIKNALTLYLDKYQEKQSPSDRG